MLYIISPTKTMKCDGGKEPISIPILHAQAFSIMEELRTLSIPELCEKLHIKEKLAQRCYEDYQKLAFDLKGTCAIETYDGLQFKHMLVKDMSDEQLAYIQQHVRIISGLYGIVKPLDSIYPYRLDFLSNVGITQTKNLYDFWKDRLAQVLMSEVASHSQRYIVNLASKEYAQSVCPYLNDDYVVHVVFEVEKNGKRKTEATRAKMARGRMIQYVAKHQVTTLTQLKEFREDDYQFDEQRSDAQHLVFYKKVETL